MKRRDFLKLGVLAPLGALAAKLGIEAPARARTYFAGGYAIGIRVPGELKADYLEPAPDGWKLQSTGEEWDAYLRPMIVEDVSWRGRSHQDHVDHWYNNLFRIHRAQS